jgi:hypothetical protein
LYILNDYYGTFSGLKPAYVANDDAVNYFSQVTGKDFGEFVYYQGLRAPLKIWKADYPLGTPTYKEFLAQSYSDGTFKWGGLDSLFN